MDQKENIGNLVFTELVVFTISSINARFFTCLDYVYKDL